MIKKFNGTNRGLHIARPHPTAQTAERPAHVSKSVTAVPDLDGRHAKAWLHNTAAVRAEAPPGQHDAMVSYWLVEAPRASIFLHSYVVMTTHLREVPGIKEPVKYKHDATHEIVVYALHPNADRDRMLRGPVGMDAMMQPCNFAAQFGPVSDDEANDMAARAVIMICSGSLSPDVSGQGIWAQIFGDNMLASAAREDSSPVAASLAGNNTEDET